MYLRMCRQAHMIERTDGGLLLLAGLLAFIRKAVASQASSLLSSLYLRPIWQRLSIQRRAFWRYSFATYISA